jgi:O-antigen/teichoic acid export membrane protein
MNIPGISRYLNKGGQRTANVKKNVLWTGLLRATDLSIGYVLTPMILSILSATTYGILLTITSIVDWFQYLDIGFGKGLLNRFNEALSKKDHERAKGLLSTTYFYVALIFGIVFILFAVATPFIPWSRILNAPTQLNPTLRILALVIFFGFLMRMVFGLVNSVISAFQQTYLIQLQTTFTKVLLLAIVSVIAWRGCGTLLQIGIVQSMLFGLAPLVISIFLYRSPQGRPYIPRLRYVDRKLVPDVMNLGLRFFVVQIAVLINLSTNNFLISFLVAPQYVTSYQIALKYFSITMMISTILSNPLWPAYTEAFVKRDISWIDNMLRKTRLIWFGLTIINLGMLVVATPVYHFWIHDRAIIPFSLSFAVMCYVMTQNWIRVYHFMLNGSGHIKMQMLIFSITAVLNIPLSIFLVKVCGWGVNGIVWASVFCQLPHVVLAPIQVRKILAEKAKGIWC